MDPDALRTRLVADLLASGTIRTDAVADAMRAIPRHRFVPDLPPAVAYEDHAQATLVRGAQPLSSISQPAMVAMMLERAELAEGHRVLEVGTGTGYNAALIAHLVGPLGDVWSVDVEPELVSSARARLDELGVADVEVAVADGRQGWPEHAPFDRVIVTAGAAEVAPAWAEQLVDGGRLVVPLSPETACVTYRREADELVEVDRVGAAFLPVRDPG